MDISNNQFKQTIKFINLLIIHANKVKDIEEILSSRETGTLEHASDILEETRKYLYG